MSRRGAEASGEGSGEGSGRAPRRRGTRVAFAPGRVNLIGDHTDHTGGWALPTAILLGTTVALEPGGRRVRLVSEDEAQPAVVELDVEDPAALEPGWARYVAGVVAETAPRLGGVGTVRSSLPIGAGLASSASLALATALALGFEGTPTALALACQRAEQRSSGVPCGIMDQVASACGIEGHALLVDCADGAVRPVRLPGGCEVVAVHSGQRRQLRASRYALRRSECEAAEREIGPLRDAAPGDLRTIADATLRRRARHVVSENARVEAFVGALESGDLTGAGAVMSESHASLRDDFEVSTPELDALVAGLAGRPGVLGARLTGAGFGGCAVALCEPRALDLGWRLTPSAGARVLDPGTAGASG